MAIKLVVFDLDGVLVDACEWHRAALNDALKEVCNFEISKEEHYREFNGLPTRVKLDKLTSRGLLDANMHSRVFELKQEKTKNRIYKEAKIRREKIELIDWLKEEKNVKVGCFTNSIRETVELVLDITGVISKLDVLVTNEDVKNPKPDPEGYLWILEQFNVPAHETVIVEDSPRGIQAAEESGCHVLKVKNSDEVNIQFFRGYFE